MCVCIVAYLSAIYSAMKNIFYASYASPYYPLSALQGRQQCVVVMGGVGRHGYW